MKIKFIVVLIAFICLGCVYFAGWSHKEEESGLVLENVSVSETEQISEPVTDETTASCLYVYVCGYVNKPGVYELAEGSRMFEAVEMAGGVCENACIQYMEMATNLYDGQRIYVPSWEEAQSQAAAEDREALGLINLNTATKSQLMELPGVGEAKAEAIIAYRNEHGNFATVEDVMNISGIKEAAFDKMKDYICVN